MPVPGGIPVYPGMIPVSPTTKSVRIENAEIPKEENSDSETETMSFLGTRGGPVILH